MYQLFIKPLLDFFVALIAILLFSPLFGIVFILLMINNNGSVFFFQTRPGKHGDLFKIIKFKTMNDKKDNEGNLLSDEIRLTTVGKIVRKTSLDEIPQLLNVIKGNMSIVGPRPLLPAYLKLYSKEQARRHDVKPGITGWAQVNGRNTISWEKKFEYDVWYINNISLLVDLRILLMTIKKVINSEDINTEGQATTTPFKG